MKTRSIQLFLICILLICIVSCKKSFETSPPGIEETAGANFPDGSLFSQPRERPFKGRIGGKFLSTPTANPAVYNSVANATGNVTHLGVFSKVTVDVINLVSSTVEGIFIMTNQNNDQIRGTYNGTFAFGDTPGTFSWDLTATITGGTGRFSTATGQFVFLAAGVYVIEEGVVKGEYTETFDGTIIY